ncbi:aldehyde dehydrogenase (NADP(+)) [Phycicoccus ginsengisoli]
MSPDTAPVVSADVSHDPRTGKALGQVSGTAADEVEAALARAADAAPTLAATGPGERAGWLRTLADALEAPDTAARLVALADRETALGEPRLTGEVARVAAQLRFYADVAQEGSWLEATIDHATATTPWLGRLQQPLGPVAVFGASNFPFAFGVLGNDTASALAAGCPVVAKAHPAHPLLSEELGRLATEALAEVGAPPGAFGLVAGFTAGTSLVTSRHIAAVAFTGSQQGGLALWRLANERDVVIPVFAEMGTVNPVVLTAAGAARVDEVAGGFVGSFTLGSGQFCTKPGLLLVPAGSRAAEAVGRALEAAAPRGWLLTDGIARAAATGVEELVAAGARVVAQVPMADGGWAAPATVLSVPAAALVRGSRLLEECFGPVAVVAEYADEHELRAVVGQLQGALAASVMTAGPGNDDGDGDPDLPAAVALLAPLVGRVAVDDWPTGVAWTWAQQHGGPWPATSVPGATSVGAAALDRFTRPVAYQSVPDAALPPALRADNPWHLPRRVDGRLQVPS